MFLPLGGWAWGYHLLTARNEPVKEILQKASDLEDGFFGKTI
jgi:hypothetical protein